MPESYCQASECHDPMTMYYGLGGNTSSGGANLAPMPRLSVVIYNSSHPGARRLCSIHARHEFGVSWGGRVRSSRPAPTTGREADDA